MSALDPSYQRIVIKIGSALLVDAASGLRNEWLSALAEDINKLREEGRQVLLVSSGAIALGRTVLGLPRRPLRLEENQAAAAVGQITLARAWSEALSNHDQIAGQILLTLKDTEGRESRRSYLNARDTIERLLSLGAVPVINENDTVATSEIRYGDNDRLAARVATMTNSDLLILLSDIDGLYTAPPGTDPNAEFVPVVKKITPAIEAMAGSAGSELSRGGMVTKIEAGKIATQSGATMVITSGKPLHPVGRLLAGERATWFYPQNLQGPARKAWIAGQLELSGHITVDEGAARALARGKSLLPAGVVSVSGSFERGDAIEIRKICGEILGKGIAGFDSDDAALIAGKQSSELTDILGYEGRSTMIHRDDMALSDSEETELVRLASS